MIGILAARILVEQVFSAQADTEVLPKRLLAGHEQHVAIGRSVELIANAFPHTAKAWLAALEVVTRVAGDYIGGLLVGLPTLDAIPVEVRSSVALRDLHVGTLTGCARTHQRGEHRHRTKRWARGDADIGLVGRAAESVGIDHWVHLTSPRIEGNAMGGQIAIRAGGAIAADAAKDDGGVDLA